MKITDDKKLKLKAMLGMPESFNLSNNVQLPVADLPINAIHYELYDGHIELHIENSSDNYAELRGFLETHLPETEVSCKCEKRSFCVFAYRLCRGVNGWGNVTDLGHAIIALQSIVTPVMLKYMDMETEKIKLAKDLVAFYEEEKKSQPFHINVIDELHADENAHTRILTRLLDYQTDGQRVILKSFLNLLPDFNEAERDVNSSSVYFNRDFIDCLIECPGKFAVIVENKIHNAVDQDKQIERYVDTEIDNGIPKDKIWVIYLTMDGSKVVGECSLTGKAKSILCDRFIALDYRNHILPWLKTSILPNCKLKEDWLISALKQYTDHLEGLFGIRSSQFQLLNQMKNKVYQSIGVTDNMNMLEKHSLMGDFSKDLAGLQNIVDTLRADVEKPVVAKFENATLHVLSDICPDRTFNLNNKISDEFYQILVNDWGNEFWQIHFEWIPLDYKRLIGTGKTEYELVVHIEDEDLACKMDALLQNAAQAEEGCEIGVSKIDNVIYYRKKITEKKTIAEMTDEELHEFLSNMYSDVPKLIEFMEKNKIAPVDK